MGRIIKIVFYSMILTICCLSPIQAEEIPYLLTASAKGDIETVKAIIGSGGNPNTSDKDNITALMYAARKDQVEVARYLLDQGALINKAEKDGWTALMFAVKKKLH